MSSTFKNRLPKRKYRERAQPEARAHLGALEKKKDYKARATNYHKKEDMLNQLKTKAALKNDDEFYFQMAKGKRNQEGKFVQDDSEDDSDFDEKEYRTSLKTENYGIVLHQRSVVQGKIDKLKGQLHLLQSGQKLNKHTVFVDNQQQLSSFIPQEHFKTTKQLAQGRMLDISPHALSKPIFLEGDQGSLKYRYTRLAEYMQKDRKLTKLLLKIGQQKAILGKQRSKIKKHKGKKIHKFFIERKK